MQSLVLEMAPIVHIFSIKYWCKAGGNLFPLLFSVFLNDLTEIMSHAFNGLNGVCNISHLLFDNDDIEVYFKLYLLLYADDTVIFAETAARLQSALKMQCICTVKLGK